MEKIEGFTDTMMISLHTLLNIIILITQLLSIPLHFLGPLSTKSPLPSQIDDDDDFPEDPVADGHICDIPPSNKLVRHARMQKNQTRTNTAVDRAIGRP